jgi:hypothetical protein
VHNSGDIEAAKEKLASDIEQLDAIVRESRIALPHQDGAERILSAADALSVAREALETLMLSAALLLAVQPSGLDVAPRTEFGPPVSFVLPDGNAESKNKYNRGNAILSG